MVPEEELRDARKRYNIFILKGLADANGQVSPLIRSAFIAEKHADPMARPAQTLSIG